LAPTDQYQSSQIRVQDRKHLSGWLFCHEHLPGLSRKELCSAHGPLWLITGSRFLAFGHTRSAIDVARVAMLTRRLTMCQLNRHLRSFFGLATEYYNKGTCLVVHLHTSTRKTSPSPSVRSTTLGQHLKPIADQANWRGRSVGHGDRY
jgi:hypothetical protein